ncbi:hypothetical protein LXA43DRAFT_737347 [Ganoderma leucocontextum]|nr:hypothetical protein LXA43DRAFT_737347 [Ganoderma leucocontextum]
MSSLPPEIWGLVIDLLQHRDQRTCLFLSRVHHHIAFSNLFSHVTVTFGLWIWRSVPQSNDGGNRQRMVRRNNITWEVLQAISFRPDFARVVREFTVLAHGWERGEYVFEKRCLIHALEVLPNLRMFHCAGTYGPRAPAIASLFVPPMRVTMQSSRAPKRDSSSKYAMTPFLEMRILQLIPSAPGARA